MNIFLPPAIPQTKTVKKYIYRGFEVKILRAKWALFDSKEESIYEYEITAMDANSKRIMKFWNRKDGLYPRIFKNLTKTKYKSTPHVIGCETYYLNIYYTRLEANYRIDSLYKPIRFLPEDLYYVESTKLFLKQNDY